MKHPDCNPLFDSVPAEVPLENAPLVRVIVQVHFPLIASIEKQTFIASFQEAVREVYPILRSERVQRTVFGPEGVVPTQEEQVWRFFDTDENWRISLAPDFVAIDAKKYKSRTDLLSRLRVVLQALEEHIRPKVIDRIGLRYVDRVVGEEFFKLAEFIRPEILGILGHSLSHYATHSLSETAFHIPSHDAVLNARWGRIPSNGSVDPVVIAPVEEESWILDLDMFSKKIRPFDAEILCHLASDFAERLYSFFRWTVTESFLRHYGGKP